MAKEVCRCVANRMRQLPPYSGANAEEDFTPEEEDQPAPSYRRRRKQIKSGMDWTEATTLVYKVTWPHEIVYTSAGKPASYQNISIPPFVHGYMIVMVGEEVAIKKTMAAHLKELMSKAEVYGWECTRAFHGVWLNQLEQGRCW